LITGTTERSIVVISADTPTTIRRKKCSKSRNYPCRDVIDDKIGLKKDQVSFPSKVEVRNSEYSVKDEPDLAQNCRKDVTFLLH